jgi:hypothetical protein
MPSIEENIAIERPGLLEPKRPVGEVVYHFTDTIFLPFILSSGELEPSPDDVLWATTDPNGDRLAWACKGSGRQFYSHGQTKRVRFTMNADDCHDGWSADRRDRERYWSEPYLRKSAREQGQSTKCWRWRDQPLSVDETLIEIRGYRDARWILVEHFSIIDCGDLAWGIRLGDWLYCSTFTDDGPYAIPPLHIDELEDWLRLDEVVDAANDTSAAYFTPVTVK